MGTIAVGDVHGYLDPLRNLLDQIRAHVTRADIVVFLGDYIDRGPRTRECIDAVLEFRDAVKANVVFLCGNHEDWLLRTLHDHRRHSWLLGMEAFDTIRSYSPGAALALREAAGAAGADLLLTECALPYEVFFDELPAAHRRFFEELLPCSQTPECICVHGGVDTRVRRLQDQSRDSLIWGGQGFPELYDGEEIIVYGHWNNGELDGRGWPHPKILGRTIGIDTIAHGMLTAIRLPEQVVVQSARGLYAAVRVER